MQYIYKIENIINHKIYIGLTNDWQRRCRAKNGETARRIEQFRKELDSEPVYIA